MYCNVDVNADVDMDMDVRDNVVGYEVRMCI